MSNILSIRGLHKVYDNGVHALKNISLDVKEGEFLCIIGLSGSGKSTLIRCINRLIEPTSGSIKFRDTEVTKLTPKELRHTRRNIGMIFQHFNLVKRKSVLTNVLSGKLGSHSTTKSLLGIYSQEDHDKALKNLKIVGLQKKLDHRADELSGGQQQRVAIARTLMQDPQILLCDEPVASLDPATSHSVMDNLRLANRELGKTIVCNLHFLSLVREYATRVIALKAGEVVFDGSPEEINETWFKTIYGEDAKEVQVK